MNALKPDYSFPAQPIAPQGSSARKLARTSTRKPIRTSTQGSSAQVLPDQVLPGQQPMPKERSTQRSPEQPVKRRQARARARQNPDRILAIEACAKLGINLFLSVIAGAALVKLIPFNLGQEASLKELQGKVAEVQGRVDTLQADFNYHFDPQQTLNAMQEQSVRTIPGQRQIVLVEQDASVAESPR